MKRITIVLLCLSLIVSFVACGNKDTGGAENETKGTTANANPSTDATQTDTPVNANPSTDATQMDATAAASPSEGIADKIEDPTNGTILNVDLTVRGEIKANAPTMNSGEFILEGNTMQLPFAGSVLVDEGWHFSENNTAKDTVIDPNATTNLVSFYIYDTDGNEMLLYQAVNDSNSAKPVLECQISSFAVDTSSLDETFGDLILPGGICLFSKAADVIAVFGTPENNAGFERVEVSEHGIRYVEHKESGLCYSFRFYSSEDYNGEANGYIRSIGISTDY